MTSVNYSRMNIDELRKYVLMNRDDNEAFQAYIDMSKASGRMITVDLSDPDWEDKVIEAVKKSSS